MKKPIIVGLLFFTFMVLAFPLGTMQHELGHIIAAEMADIPVTLSYASVHEPEDLDDRGYFLLCLGGPLATWSFALTAFVILLLGHRRWWHKE